MFLVQEFLVEEFLVEQFLVEQILVEVFLVEEILVEVFLVEQFITKKVKKTQNNQNFVSIIMVKVISEKPSLTMSKTLSFCL